MKNSPYIRSILANAALEFVPPLIRQTLLAETNFREEYGLEAKSILSFGDSGIHLQSTDLFNAVQMILSGAPEEELADTDGQKWKLRNIAGEGEFPSLSLARDKYQLILPNFSALSQDSSIRLRFLEQAASDVNLPDSTQDAWSNILSKRPLEDDEVDEFLREFYDTPIEKGRSIHDDIESGEIKISNLVPHSRRYFERLVGVYDGSSAIHDYAASSGKRLLHQLSAWRPYDGFLFSLLNSSHSSMTAEININRMGSEDLVNAYDFLDKLGDRTSQLGAIEVGLRILPSRPEIEPVLIRLVKQIRDDDIDGKASEFNLLSALFIFVDGELSRTRLLSAEPPFYRRLAALSQAALIHRQFRNASVDINKFSNWAFNNRAEQFYMQSLADMRLEPRWNPDLAVAPQMKADYFGRIMIAAKNHSENIREGELSDIVLKTTLGSLHSLSVFYPYLPGPLEGVEESQNTLPTEIAEIIETQLSEKDVGPSSFIALVNSALIFHVDANQAELAARVLKLARYRLANVEDRSQLLAILNGLASVAAIARSRTLADELRILVRSYKRDVQYSLSIKEAMRICLVAAASRADLADWREFVGDWMTELAFSNLEGHEGEVLYSHLQCLCHAVPELWVSCGRADAALRAYIDSR